MPTPRTGGVLLMVLISLLFLLSGCSDTEDAGSNPDGDLDTEGRVDDDVGDDVSDDAEEAEEEAEEVVSFCGDGTCSFGEFAALCPEDCDGATLAATPPMGWNSWNRYHCDISEQLIRETADAMVESGMRDAGYVYLNIDDCWQISRDESGRIVTDPDRFPGDMKDLADYVHSKGLKFGLYTCAGTMTCQQRPGSHDHETIDAQTYAEWGVDYIKVDWCFTDGLDARTAYATMRDALLAAGRPIVFSICNWGVDQPHVWGPETGQLWRTTMDITDLFGSMLSNFNHTQHLGAYAGIGRWNDPDMLEVGNGFMTEAEYRSHMSLWAIIAAPLIAGNDLRSMDDATRAILLNTEVIAVDQDPLGLAGMKISEGVWARPLAREGLRAVVFFNPGKKPVTRRIAWRDLGLQETPALVRDLWKHDDLGSFEAGFEVEVGKHESVMITVQGREMAPAGRVDLGDQPARHAANSLGPLERNRSVGGEEAGDGTPITLRGAVYDKGLGAGGASIIEYHLGGRCTRFLSDIGLDDSAPETGSVRFEVFADGVSLYRSEVLTKESAVQSVDVDLTGRTTLRLTVGVAGDSADGDLAVWAGARIECGE